MGKSKELAELGNAVTQSGGTTTFSDDTTAIVSTQSGSITLQNYAYATGFTYDLSNASQAHSVGTSSSAPTILKTGNVERMRIDASGRVTMPYQPAFNAYLIQNPSANGYSTGGVYHASLTGIGVNPTNILILKHTVLNRGNHYSTTTGLFTAPVAGVYRFHHAHLPDSTQGGNVDNWAEFYINGGSTDAPEMYVQTSQLSQHGAQLSGSAIFQLQANDTVGVYMYGGMHQRYATFNGYLIG